ncbi:hypothetical protein I1A62_38900 [Rhodococcus sp. USK10]|uniref:hypothetical protein n=1 Tax=Rhodococcus sp. USK10 TaxID=2789739 RepID=UPI001C5CE9EA|nr:hypothetical protein [Rhodococcus sp. USK10]QYB03076.1 hypothetical protein I1A62_38900 [Rhodococcus sp. USK10]
MNSSLSIFFCPQQKLISKIRDGGEGVTKKCDTAITPHRRVERHSAARAEDKAILAVAYTGLNPAAIQRQIQALTAELLTLTTAKSGPTPSTSRHGRSYAHPRPRQRSKTRAHLA